jgi:hypothetical protein
MSKSCMTPLPNSDPKYQSHRIEMILRERKQSSDEQGALAPSLAGEHKSWRDALFKLANGI